MSAKDHKVTIRYVNGRTKVVWMTAAEPDEASVLPLPENIQHVTVTFPRR